ncbi:hypothetical protein VME0621_03878 [Vibrio mediterranei]|nr:hypothetical protein VME0621_03878 [Vibrio mediterranei]
MDAHSLIFYFELANTLLEPMANAAAVISAFLLMSKA